ncbi:hypothetical protein D3C72_1285160 [compost metagenome]
MELTVQHDVAEQVGGTTGTQTGHGDTGFQTGLDVGIGTQVHAAGQAGGRATDAETTDVQASAETALARGQGRRLLHVEVTGRSRLLVGDRLVSSLTRGDHDRISRESRRGKGHHAEGQGTTHQKLTITHTCTSHKQPAAELWKSAVTGPPFFSPGVCKDFLRQH